jgi:hypothetical protein
VYTRARLGPVEYTGCLPVPLLSALATMRGFSVGVPQK